MKKEELESKHLAELHALAADAGVPRYRMLPKAELVEALAAGNGTAAQRPAEPEVVTTGVAEAPRPPRRRRRRRFLRRRKGGPREHADRWLEAWNAHDIDAILECYAEEIDFASPTVAAFGGPQGGQLRGREELRAHFARGLERAPALAFTEEALLTGSGGYALVYRREDGARVVESVELNEDGEAIRARAFYEGS
ncbi:MAG TPA: nuclear transport factor 2 family protein [Solirubrobacterales bacterium]